VYIGQLEPPVVPISDDAEEKDHLDMSKPEVIKFKFANTDHKELVKDTCLPPGTGICHEAFAEKMTTYN